MNLRRLIEEGFLPLYAPVGGGGGEGDFVPDAGDDEALTADEQALIDAERTGSPMPSKDEGGDPAAEGDKPRPNKATAKGGDDPDEDTELEEGEEEVTIDKNGRARDPKTAQFVSKSAYLREKESKKALRDQLQQTNAKQAKLEGRLELLNEILASDPEAKKSNGKDDKSDNPWDEADIDPVDDIVKAFDQQRRRNAWTQKELKAEREGRTARDTTHTAIQTYVADITAFQKTEPAIKDAYNHVIAGLHRELELVGGITDKAERDKLIRQQETKQVQEWLAAGKSPAQMLWHLAQSRGFVKPAANGKTNGKGNGNGDARAKAEAEIEELNEAQRATKSLSGAGGASGTGLTFEQLDAMDDEEFAAFASKMTEGQRRKYLGG